MGEFIPKAPIEFSANGVPGFSISQAVDEDYAGLDGRDEEMITFENTSVTCRIHVGTIASQTNIPPTSFPLVLWPRPVHVQSKTPQPRQVPFLLTLTQVNTAERRPIQRSMLVKEIGKRVKQYVEASAFPA